MTKMFIIFTGSGGVTSKEMITPSDLRKGVSVELHVTLEKSTGIDAERTCVRPGEAEQQYK